MFKHLFAKSSFALLLLATHAYTYATPLEEAKTWLDQLPKQQVTNRIENWDYAQACTLDASGTQKLGCALKTHPGVGLVICKESSCNDRAAQELELLTAIGQSGIGVIPFVNKIYAFPCKSKPSSTCSGYMLQWFDGDKGKFYKPIGSDEIAFKAKVKTLSEEKQARTCTDFKAIAAQWDTKGIGDFQGVLVFDTGHFLVADPTRFAKGIVGLSSIKRVCSAICPSKCP